MSKTQLSILFAVLLVASIAVTHIVTQTNAQQTQLAPSADNDYQTGAVLWFQKSGEYRALAFQAFELARLRLDQQLKFCRKSRKSKLPCAIITDIDETILDNSPNQAFLILNKRNFNNADWQNWTNLESAQAIPGALEFFQYAAKAGIKPFYVTNRGATEKAATVNNLKKSRLSRCNRQNRSGSH